MATFPKSWPSVWASDEVNRSAVNYAEQRRAECEVIAEHARDEGLNTTPAHVNMHFRRYRQWHEGNLATGYLMKLTGVRRLEQPRDGKARARGGR